MATSPINRHSPPPSTTPPPGTTPEAQTPRPSVGQRSTRSTRGSGELATLSRQSPSTSRPPSQASSRLRAPLPDTASARDVERLSTQAEPAGDAVATVAEAQTVEETRRQAQTAAPSISEAALTLASEFLAKGTASFIHFGLTSNFTQAGVSHLLGKMFTETHPLATAATQAAATALPLAFTHAFAEVVARTAILQVSGHKLVEWKAEQVFPDNPAAQKSFKALQGASKIGSTTGNAIGLAAFCLVQGGGAAAGFSSPLESAGRSAVAGGSMALLHSLMGMLTTVEGEHTHRTESTNPKEVIAAVTKAVNVVVTKGGEGHKLAEGLHEIVVTRGSGSLLGLMSSLLYKAHAEVQRNGADAPQSKVFQEAATSTFMLLGLFFFSHLSMADRRLPGSGELFENTKKTLAATFDMEKAIAGGSMTELTKKLGDSPAARGVIGAAKVADATNHVVSNAATLPMRGALDTIEAAEKALQTAKQAIIAKATGEPAQPDVELGRTREAGSPS